jgi:hypothetical protein
MISSVYRSPARSAAMRQTNSGNEANMLLCSQARLNRQKQILCSQPVREVSGRRLLDFIRRTGVQSVEANVATVAALSDGTFVRDGRRRCGGDGARRQQDNATECPNAEADVE